MDEFDDDAAVTAQILRSLDVVLSEFGAIDRTLLAGPLNESLRREARRQLLDVQARAQALMDWVSRTRLEEDTN